MSMRRPSPAWNPTSADLSTMLALQSKESLMETVVAACAAVAYADGWVAPAERRRMLAAIRGSDVLAVFPPADVLQSFDEIIRQFEEDEKAAESWALEQVAGLKALDIEARMLVAACYAVAAADLQIDSEERTLVLCICELLGVDPAELDLVEAA